MGDVCSRCESRSFVFVSRRLGKPLCQYCRNILFATRAICVQCGKRDRIHSHDDDGNPLCQNCYQKSRVGKCDGCGKNKIIQGLGFCYACYQRQRRQKKKQLQAAGVSE